MTGHPVMVQNPHGIVGQASCVSLIPSPSLSLTVSSKLLCSLLLCIILASASSHISPIPLRSRSGWSLFMVNGQLSNKHTHCSCS